MTRFVAMLITIVFMFPACKSSKPMKTQADNYIGKINRTTLQDGDFAAYYQKQYADYTVHPQIGKAANFIEPIRVQIVLGSWCHDSQVQVPRFLKIMDYLEMAPDRIQILGLDTLFQAPGENLASLAIERVPTFIIYQNKKEIGRIVENPIQSLEADLLQILIPGQQ